VLLAAIRNVARNVQQAELADEVHQYYLTHPLKKANEHFRLLPKERDHDSYVALIRSQGEPTGRLAEALAHFEALLTERATEDPATLRSIFDTITQRLEFMCATLEAENAYNIFKSLNSTGVPLGASDLIRNFVFMHVAPEGHDEFDSDLWSPLEDRFSKPDGTLDEERFSRFFRDFLMSAGRYISPRDTFSTFEARYEATGFSPVTLARTLLDASADYEVIASARSDPSATLTHALLELNALESSTTYPLLLAMFGLRRAGVIDSDDLARATQMLRGFVYRRFICGESSRGYGQMFVRALAKAGEPAMKRLEAFLLERGWPEDHRFRTSFVVYPLYQRDYTKHTLEVLEQARGHKEPVSLDDAEIEHVLPQTLNDAWRKDLGEEAERIQTDWLHTPGNLTLSGYNPELWNHPFAVKRERYGESHIELTRELASYSTWGEQTIKGRGEIMATAASGIWIGPKEQFVRPEAVPVEGGALDLHEVRQRFWTSLNDYLVLEYPELPDIEPRQSWTVRLPSGIRHVGIELRFGIRQEAVGIDVWFWRAASKPLWERIRANPAAYDALMGSTWHFEPVEGRIRARMFLDFSVPSLRNESSWTAVHEWFGRNLMLVFEKVAPNLREEMERREPDA
jgi:hypothetical protein